MFDVKRITDQVINKPILIFFDSQKGFADFCKDFLIDYLDYSIENDFERLLLIYDSYYGEHASHPNNCAIELTISSDDGYKNWGHCWKEWYQDKRQYIGYTTMHYTEFLIQSIKVSKDSLIDFLNA